MLYSELIQLPLLGFLLGIPQEYGGKLMIACYFFPSTNFVDLPFRTG